MLEHLKFKMKLHLLNVQATVSTWAIARFQTKAERAIHAAEDELRQIQKDLAALR